MEPFRSPFYAPQFVALSQGHFTWWPTTQDASARLSARELAIVLWNGNPQQAGMAEDWKKLG